MQPAEEQLLVSTKFKSRVYQPEIVSINSADRVESTLDESNIGYFNSFRIILKTPILNVKSLQLLRATIPNICTTIPDSETVFWYYRLPQQSPYQEPVPPDPQYLHCIRILPSYYPKDLMPTGETFAINRIYNTYQDLLIDLNYAAEQVDNSNPYYVPEDIEFGYDNVLNKFSFTGKSTYTEYYGNAYEGGTNYFVDNIVSVDNKNYIAFRDSLNVSPTSTDPFVGYGGDNVPLWIYEGYYNVGDYAFVEGVGYYQCIVEHSGHIYPPNGDTGYWNAVDPSTIELFPGSGALDGSPSGQVFWQLYDNLSDATLPNAVSKQYFYSYAGYNDSNVIAAQKVLNAATLNAYGIQGLAGQPYVEGRTLNLRLGFVWSGVTLSQTAYKNHIRPVPDYAEGALSLANSSLTYTAESYCDLVYSHNCHIYCNLTSGSAYGSKGEPNLLMSVPIDTSPLGVSYYVASMEMPLTKVPKEIYEIQILFKTDSGLPFNLPNSASAILDIGFSFVE